MNDPTTIDPKDLITLAEAAKLLQTRGHKRPCAETLRRWANPKRGCRVCGTKLLLCTVRVGGALLTTRGWVEAFDAARVRAGIRTPIPEAELPRPRRQREAGHRRAERALDAAGIYTRPPQTPDA